MFDSESKHNIITHMNEDHADAVLAYVHAFAGRRDANTAILTDIDEQGMDIEFQTPQYKEMTRVAYPETLTAVSQVRAVLVSMVKQARAELG